MTTVSNDHSSEKHAAAGLIGASVRRVEDLSLVTGHGLYVDDVQLPGMLHMVVVRSPHPKAKILSIDTSAARAMPGVEAVLTGEDIGDRLSLNVPAAPGMKVTPFPALALGTAHAVGVPVAVVVAQTRSIGQDAADAIVVDYEPLPSVSNADAAIEPGAPLAWDELDSNICYTAVREGGNLEQAFAEADHITRLHIASPRQVALSLEPRGVVANPEPMGQGLTVWLSTQNPHRSRADLATALKFPEHRLRMIAPDVGGGFGSKVPLYREDVLAAHLALTLGQPVKWIATRSEDFVTTIQGRDQSITSELALRRDGTMLGLRVRVVANLGAYIHFATAGPPSRMMGMAPGCYQIPNARVEVVGVYTNTTSTGPYRGAGRPEAVQNIERLVDQAAREMGLDRLELRRKNFIRPEQFPYRSAVGSEYDSGNYEGALAEALRLSHYEDIMQQRDQRRLQGELVGVGVSTFVEPSGGGFESGTIRVERTGEITVLSGSSAHGQGHETIFAQVAADKLRVGLEHVRVYHGDTAIVQQGFGSFSSRSATLGGAAIVTAADRIIEKARRIASQLLEAAPEDIVQADGGFSVTGVASRTITWRQIATAAYGGGRLPPDMELGLQETAYFDPKKEAWGFGAYVVMISIDRETGAPTIETMVLVDDCGVLINPMIVEGQIHGGLAQGLAECLREHMLFDEAGQVLTGSLLDYAVPRAGDIPPFILGETVTPNPNNPIGAKGVGEASTNGTPPAVANAVLDALSPLGIQNIDMPYTAPKLWEAIQKATAGATI